MKKILSLTALLMVMCTTVWADEPALALQGDVNGDGQVDVADISTILTVMAVNGFDSKADVNADKSVDVADISNVLTIMARADDDLDDDGGSNAVTGTWTGQGTREDEDEKITIVFRGDLTGAMTVSYYDSHYGSETLIFDFTYTLDEGGKTGVMFVKYEEDDEDDDYSDYGDSGSGGYETFYFWLDGDKLCIDDNRLYGNPEWVLTKQ